METFLNKIVPEGREAAKNLWQHTDEGEDDMPSHCKASLMGSSVSIPVTDGRFNCGVWQGVWLVEPRTHSTPREIVVTIQGESTEE